MKLQNYSSYGYQISNRSRHIVTKHRSIEKTHAVVISKLLKKLSQVNKSLYEVELIKGETEHKEPIIVGFFTRQIAKLWMLELYYFFSTNSGDVNKIG